MLMFTEQKGEGRTRQESTQSNVLYELNLGIRGYNQLVTPGPELPHTHRKALTWFGECSIQSPPKNQLSSSSFCFWVSKRSSATLVAKDREHPLGEEEIRENFRNSFVGRDTNGAELVPSMSRLKMSTLHFQSATNCQATDLSQPC